jgi:hypothetical protein
MNKFISNIQPLGADFDQVLHDNLWNLYSDSSTESATPLKLDPIDLVICSWSEQKVSGFCLKQPTGVSITHIPSGFVSNVDKGRLYLSRQTALENIENYLNENKPVTQKSTQFKSLVWSENFKPNDYCRYDHCIADTPFGEFLISWKSWKDYPSFSIDEAPGDHDKYSCYFSLDAAKQECDDFWLKTLNNCLKESK